MATTNVCDICGKIIPDYIKTRHFKIKELKPFFSYDGWRSSHWVEIDAHNSCIEMLLQAKEVNDSLKEIEDLSHGNS